MIPQSSWVFVKHTHCLYVVRTRQLSIVVDGPRRSLGCYQFANEQQLETFQMALAEELTEHGWRLCMSTSS